MKNTGSANEYELFKKKGAEGWELFQVVNDKVGQFDQQKHYFKRRIE